MNCIDSEGYAETLRQLLPKGFAWAGKTENDGNLRKLIEGLAIEASKVDCRAKELQEEIDPAITLELLKDWERVMGLPDNCTELATSIAERRKAILFKLNLIGGQTVEFYIDIALYFGYIITITEFNLFRVGSSPITDPIYDEGWAHVFQVNSALDTFVYFLTGASEVGIDPLRKWGNETLECLINELKPAHTQVIFSYT